jgi:site-specific DNA-methyltransferase (adenine-specific)
MTTETPTALSNTMNNRAGTLMRGDCIPLMRKMTAESMDFLLTDPPYLVNYRDRSGRTVTNDDNGDWLQPAFAEMFRLLKQDSFCISFYSWNKVDLFMAAWKAAGFRPVAHIVFRKKYASSSRFMEHRHEQAYLLAKGWPPTPARPPPDVIDWIYTGNRLHPTQKPLGILKPLIEAFTLPGQIVLDPFAGSGSTLIAARQLKRRSVGIELDPAHYQTAANRLTQPANPRSPA